MVSTGAASRVPRTLGGRPRAAAEQEEASPAQSRRQGVRRNSTEETPERRDMRLPLEKACF